MANLYDIMEIPMFSSLERVKRQYKVLAFKYHPDAHQGDKKFEEKFKAISKAYQVLSDPKQKLVYDQVLYTRILNPRSKASSGRKSPYKAPAKYPERTRKKGFSSILWIIVFFGIGFIFYQLVWQVNNFIQSKDIETKLETRSTLMDQAKDAASRGRYNLALDYLDLVQYNVGGQDIRELRRALLKQSEREASDLMKAGDFADARRRLSMLITRGDRVKEEWYVALAICYRRLGNVDYSVELLENLLAKNPDLLTANKEIAFIYKNDLGDFDKALFYLERATAIIVNNYIDHYGNAYYVVIDPNNHPPTDFDVFLEKAQVYSVFKQYDKAISACKWAEVLNPESADPNVLMGYNYFQAGDYSNACKSINKARKKGGEIPEDLQKINC